MNFLSLSPTSRQSSCVTFGTLWGDKNTPGILITFLLVTWNMHRFLVSELHEVGRHSHDALPRSDTYVNVVSRAVSIVRTVDAASSSDAQITSCLFRVVTHWMLRGGQTQWSLDGANPELTTDTLDGMFCVTIFFQ